MKKSKKEAIKLKIKDNKAITLIALVITIALNCYRSGRKKECTA